MKTKNKKLHKLAMEIYQIYQFKSLHANGQVTDYEYLSPYGRERYNRCLNIATYIEKKNKKIESEYIKVMDRSIIFFGSCFFLMFILFLLK